MALRHLIACSSVDGWFRGRGSGVQTLELGRIDGGWQLESLAPSRS